MKKLLITFVITFVILTTISINGVLANPSQRDVPSKPGNHELSERLAKVNKWKQEIANKHNRLSNRGVPYKPGNPGLPGCLAQVASLNQEILDHDNVILETQKACVNQVNSLEQEMSNQDDVILELKEECSVQVNGLDQELSEQDNVILDLQKEINSLQSDLDAMDTLVNQLTNTTLELQKEKTSLQSELLSNPMENYAPVAKTGQKVSYVPGDDGDLQMGSSANPRFTDNANGTVTDNLTGLMWVKSPQLLTNNSISKNWREGIDFCNNLDYSGYSDWRLPNVKELLSLVDYGQMWPALPVGHLFTGIPSELYWSSTPSAYCPDLPIRVSIHNGNVDQKIYNDGLYRIWPVRSVK